MTKYFKKELGTTKLEPPILRNVCSHNLNTLPHNLLTIYKKLRLKNTLLERQMLSIAKQTDWVLDELK